MGNAQMYWARVAARRAEIARQILDQFHQPKDGRVFVVSLDNREKGTTAGSVTLTTLDMAAKLVEELGLRQLWFDRVSGTILAEASP